MRSGAMKRFERPFCQRARVGVLKNVHLVGVMASMKHGSAILPRMQAARAARLNGRG